MKNPIKTLKDWQKGEKIMYIAYLLTAIFFYVLSLVTIIATKNHVVWGIFMILGGIYTIAAEVRRSVQPNK